MKTKHFDFGPRTGCPPDEDWNCSVTFRDEEEQDPFEISFYVWRIGNLGEDGDLGWRVRMEHRLAAALGYPVRIIDMSSGNGHGGATIERVP